jgi:transposase
MSANELSNLSREELLALVLRLSPVVTALQERVAALEEENRQLRAQLSRGSGGSAVQREPPSFVKANRAAREKKQRKKRERPAFRRREEPTEVREHGVETCPDCGWKLSGGWVARTRQVIEIPVAAVQIIEHRMQGRHCGVCGKDWVARPDLSLEVVGQSRVGVGLMSLIALWREEGRLPIRVIQRLLMAQYGLHLSIGELVEVLHTVSECGQTHYASLREQIRQASCVNADETSWREDGENGYLWSFSTPSVCYQERHASRGSGVVQGVLGEREREADAFGGVLCSDFYAAYSWYPGEHQRCWTHLLGDLHELKEKHPKEPSVQEWAKAVKTLYQEAKGWVDGHADAPVLERRGQRFVYQARLAELAKPYAKVEGVAQRVLAQRLLRFEPELFTFVEYANVPSENNAAERALRPSVIARKISGGTRSEKGSKTRCVLRSLFATWKVQGRDLMHNCRRMLTGTLEPVPT